MENKIIAFGLIEEGALIQAQNCLKDAEYFALMADNHKGYGMPVGGVAVYKGKISPANAVIVEGVDSKKSKEAFYSTVHGAGRVMSRTQAAGKKKFVKVERTRPDGTTYMFKAMQQVGGKVNMEKVRKEMYEKGIILKGGGADEAPEVYKKLPEVLELHKGTIEIKHTLEPLIVVMAGSNEFDPYKD